MHIAVITEYNPFHKGHEYQLSEIRKAFPDACITAIMGGIFSQRGAPYITTPYVRAEAAILCGADLVLELPFPFSCAPATVFARAGVEIAAKIGADVLAFGSECGDIAKLKTMLLRLDSAEMKEAVEKSNHEIIGKSRAYSTAYKALYGEECSDMPNDILAIEYLRAINNGGYNIIPYTIKRIGDFKSGENGFASATSIRKNFKNGSFEKIACDLPSAAKNIYESNIFGADIERISSAIIMNLFSANTVAFSGGGLLGHVKNAAATAKSIEELTKKAATKRYTDAEISRCLLFALLNVTSDDLESPVYYTKLFAATKKGCDVLNREHGIEIITKPSAVNKLSKKAKIQYEKTFAAERAFALCLDGKYEFTKQSPRII